MVTFKQQVVEKALDNYIEAQERGLEVAQKALAMHQKMHRAEVQEAEALGRPVSEIEYIDEDERTLSDELRDGQREIEAIRQRIEDARTARITGPRASEDFLNDHQGDTWRDQTALDDFGVAPPEDSGLGPIEGYEPGRPGPSAPDTEPSTVDASGKAPPVDARGEPPPVGAGARTKAPTLRTGEKQPDWTLKPGGAQPPSGPSAPPTVEHGGESPPAGGAESSEGPGVVSRIAEWVAGTALIKAAQVGVEAVKGRYKKIAVMVGAAAAAVGLIYSFWPSGGEPAPRPPEPPGVQTPSTPNAPEPAPPNPFVPPNVPEPAPPNPFTGPESPSPNPFSPAPPPANPFVPPHAPEPAPPNPFEPGRGTGGAGPAVPPAIPAPPNPFEPGQHGGNPGGDTGGGHSGDTGTGGGHSGDTGTGGGTDTGGGTGGAGGTGDGTGGTDTGGTGTGGTDTGGTDTGGGTGSTGGSDGTDTGGTGGADTGGTTGGGTDTGGHSGGTDSGGATGGGTDTGSG